MDTGFKPKVHCIENHEASLFCTDVQCQFPAARCKTEGCQSQRHHSNCLQAAHSEVIVNKIIQKGQTFSQVSDPVSEIYLKAMKSLQRDYNQYINSKSKFSFHLFDQELELYNLLKEGKWNKISTSLIISVAKSLKKQQAVSVAKLQEEVDKQVQSAIELFQNVLAKIKSKWNSKLKSQSENNISIEKSLNQSKWRFQPNLCHSDAFEISNNGFKIKRTNQHDKNQYFALLEPSLDVDHKIKRIKLKIVNLNRLVHFGVVHLSEIKDFMLNVNNRGVGGGAYLINNAGFILTNHQQNQNKSTQFRFNNGDQLLIEYDPGFWKLTITNLTKKLGKVQLNLKRQKSNPLYACVNMAYAGSQVQVLE